MEKYNEKLGKFIRGTMYVFVLFALISLLWFDSKLLFLIFMLCGICSFITDITYFMKYYTEDDWD